MTTNMALFARIVSKLDKNSFRKLVREKAADKHFAITIIKCPKIWTQVNSSTPLTIYCETTYHTGTLNPSTNRGETGNISQ